MVTSCSVSPYQFRRQSFFFFSSLFDRFFHSRLCLAAPSLSIGCVILCTRLNIMPSRFLVPECRHTYTSKEKKNSHGLFLYLDIVTYWLLPKKKIMPLWVGASIQFPFGFFFPLNIHLSIFPWHNFRFSADTSCHEIAQCTNKIITRRLIYNLIDEKFSPEK